MAALTPEEQATLDALQSKAAAPDDNGGESADAAAEVAAEVGAATVEAIASVAETVAVIVHDVHRDADREAEEIRRVENDRLSAAAAVAEVEAAVAQMQVEDLAAALVETAPEPVEETPQDVTVEEGAAAVIIDAAPGAEVAVNDSPPTGKPHPYFAPVRMPWNRKDRS